jgi:hypothetical protein
VVKQVVGSEFFWLQDGQTLAKGREKGERTGLQFLALVSRVVNGKKTSGELAPATDETPHFRFNIFVQFF